MSIPAVITIVLVVLGLSIHAIMHGKPTKHNFWLSSVDSSIFIALLYWGGFFS